MALYDVTFWGNKMAVLSLLRSRAVLPVVKSVFQPGKPLILPEFLRRTNIICIREMSSKRLMNIAPSEFQWNSFKNFLHLYTLLGVVPLATLLFFVNIFVGPAELAEIPEGYEPKHWEYYRHPVSRFMSRYMVVPAQQDYEKFMHMINEEHDRVKWRKLEKKVKELAAERKDFKAWYYVPMDAKFYRIEKEAQDEFKDCQTNVADRIF